MTLCLFEISNHYFKNNVLNWLQDLTNIDLFMTSKMVEESLKQRETSLCLSWCNENRSKLKKYKVAVKHVSTVTSNITM